MNLGKVEKKSIKVDRFDFVHTILRAKVSSSMTDEKLYLLIKVYEEVIEKDVNNNKYSPTVKLTNAQRALLSS